jgi:hypothetical protein
MAPLLGALTTDTLDTYSSSAPAKSLPGTREGMRIEIKQMLDTATN